MPNEDPFDALRAGLDALEARPKPPTPEEIRDKVVNNQRELIDSIKKFNDVLSAKNVSTDMNFISVDAQNHMVNGQIIIKKNEVNLKVLSLTFQGQAFWIADRDFVKIARREKQNGSWRSDEIDDFNKSFTNYVLRLLSEAE